EDGNIQSILEWHKIPYTGCGVLPSSIGVNKTAQKKLMEAAGFPTAKSLVLSKTDLLKNPTQKFAELKEYLGFPFVVKSPNQGSSLGVTILNEDSADSFEKAVLKSLFIEKLHSSDWKTMDKGQKEAFAGNLGDIRTGIGFPVLVEQRLCYHPVQLIEMLDATFELKNELIIQAILGESEVLFEEFVEGREFSCIVLENLDGEPVSLPPTEIIKSQKLFDYRSKYLPGLSRKITPINANEQDLIKISEEAERLFNLLQCQVYARIDGFLTSKGEVFLNDPNTTSGMMPSSFFFHQAAEIGLNPSEFLTYIVYVSLIERKKLGKLQFESEANLNRLELLLNQKETGSNQKEKVAVILGGYSSERHISVESGRNIYEKLSSSAKYQPIPIFLTGDSQSFQLYEIPVNVLLKDNADDIAIKVKSTEKRHSFLQQISDKCTAITQKFSVQKSFESKEWSFEKLASETKLAFIALHGRPGEDGALQKELEKWGIHYNGSGPESSSQTIDKYLTNEMLMKHEVLVAKHFLVEKSDYLTDVVKLLNLIEQQFSYPLIAKPSDDGCSSAVKKIRNRSQLEAFCNTIFRDNEEFGTHEAEILSLKSGEEFPNKDRFVVEELISRNGAKHFLEITGGMLTKRMPDGSIEFEVFEPSETLASGEVLSLEEKFLAGEGQNITPARFSKIPEEQKRISDLVKSELKKTAMAMNVEGYCRIDAFVRIFDDGKVETVVIEINSLPGMTPATCIYHQCALNGYKPYDFIDAILEFGKTKAVTA
ncbi:MAG: D-alanine--D-alanine ligase, partial [Cytophagales bacterium]